ncbi:oxygen-insensitive NADPH nitroreductase [Listeria ilorinensis]|uniref:oxygen-insensitive NADPH nitroreductase n=1 Tax=Listeria ilorinensis TaxID=2867439 RepID=UPI001EF5AC84|nr:oxygen-insensitive NADPH nitroreductase [Listeria ilorinensis]
MNDTIEQLLSHYSVRAFTDQALSGEEIRLLVKAAQSASTSKFIQAYSIIGVSDPEKRAILAEISGNAEYVRTTGQFFVFVSDLARSKQIAEAQGGPTESLDTIEKWLVSVVDATLAAQNMAVAAESMGLGICFIGGIRNDIKRVTELLEIPDHAMPLFGLTVGHPKQLSAPKPRMPEELIYHQDRYQMRTMEDYQQYDEEIHAYYEKRTGGTRSETWTEQIAKGMKRPNRLELAELLRKQHLAQK